MREARGGSGQTAKRSCMSFAQGPAALHGEGLATCLPSRPSKKRGSRSVQSRRCSQACDREDSLLPYCDGRSLGNDVSDHHSMLHDALVSQQLHYRLQVLMSAAEQAGRIRPATWEEKVQMLTTPGLAMDLADTVEVASFQDAAADETGEDNSQWGEGTEARQQAAPQYNAQQVLSDACRCFMGGKIRCTSPHLPAFH